MATEQVTVMALLLRRGGVVSVPDSICSEGKCYVGSSVF